jgi:hypothetical protein
MNLLRLARLPARLEAAATRDGATIDIVRGDTHRRPYLTLGPNEVHWAVIHPDGSITDCGVSQNFLTTAGRDLWAAAFGNVGFGVTGTIATGSSATSLTATGTPFTASAYVGWIVVAEETTNAPVWANIGANTTSGLTVDAWKTGDDTAGTTPGTTANYLILPSCRPRYLAVTADTGAGAVGDTTLTSEITTNGLGRAIAAYAHTPGASTYTLTKSFSVSGGPQTVHRGGLFTASTTAAAGVMVLEDVADADAIVTTSDTLACTWTVTLSG